MTERFCAAAGQLEGVVMLLRARNSRHYIPHLLSMFVFVELKKTVVDKDNVCVCVCVCTCIRILIFLITVSTSP